VGLPRKAACAAVCLLLAAPAFAWGPLAHQAVTAKAVSTLPKGLEPFYKAHRLEMPTLSPEGGPREESPERRFAVDGMLPFPFTEIPRTEAGIKAMFPQAAPGRLPWLIQESYARLVEAFKSGEKARILEESDEVAQLVADLHNPLALSTNFDGQKTSQHGLWVRFSVKLPEVTERRLHLDADAARFLDDPKEFVFDMINANYIWLDNLLFADDLAHRSKGSYTQLYYESFESRAGGILKGCLSRAAEDAGSYWYTAWTAAGRPELK